jgi:hypothetical protein
MKPTDVFEALKGVDGVQAIRIEPGITRLIVNDRDAKGAELIQMIEDRWPELKMGECIEMLLNTIWWLSLLAAIPKEEA